MKLKQPSAKLEFYSKINEIKDLYENQGYKIAKELYEFMQNKYKWKMKYRNFMRYFSKEIKNESNSFFNKPITSQKPEQSMPTKHQTEITLTQNQKKEKTSEELLSTMTPDAQKRLKARFDDMDKRHDEMEELKKQFAQKQDNNKTKEIK